MRILFVEDEEPARAGLMPLLSESGHQVDVAQDADQAVDRLRQVRYDLILLDVIISPGEVLKGVPPREAGKDLLLRLRSHGLGELKTPADIPVVAITAVADMDVVSALNSAVQHVFVKPIASEEIMETLSAILQGEEDVDV